MLVLPYSFYLNYDGGILDLLRTLKSIDIPDKRIDFDSLIERKSHVIETEHQKEESSDDESQSSGFVESK